MSFFDVMNLVEERVARPNTHDACNDKIPESEMLVLASVLDAVEASTGKVLNRSDNPKQMAKHVMRAIIETHDEEVYTKSELSTHAEIVFRDKLKGVQTHSRERGHERHTLENTH